MVVNTCSLPREFLLINFTKADMLVNGQTLSQAVIVLLYQTWQLTL
jgi:hypothetical protein